MAQQVRAVAALSEHPRDGSQRKVPEDLTLSSVLCGCCVQRDTHEGETH